MGTNYIAPIWRMPRNANKDKFSNYSINAATTSAMSISNPTQVGITSSFSFWLKRPDKTYATRVYNVGTNESYGWYMYEGGSFIRYNGNYLWPKDDPIGTLPAFRAATEIENEWVHWVITRKEVSATEQNVRIYANGALVYSVDNTTTLGTSDSTLSSLLTVANPNNDNLSSFSVYDYELQLSQVQQIYNSGTPLNEMALSYGNPVSYYLFGDNANLNAGSSGVAIPNISVGADSVFEFNSSVIEQINLGTDLNFTNAMTFTAWVKVDTTHHVNDYLTFVSNVNGAPNIKYNFRYYQASGNKFFRLQLWANNGVAKNYNTYANNNGAPNYPSISDNKWHLVGFSCDGTTDADGVRIYVDGQSWYFTADNPGIGSSTLDTRLGVYQDNSATWDFAGEMSNVQFWDTNLSDANIVTLYNNGQPLMTGTQPETANLKAWYKLNQSANWEADNASDWQIPDNRSAYPQSFKFDRASSADYDRIVIHDGPFTYPTGEVSVSAWFKWNGFAAYQTIVADDFGSGDDRIWWLGTDTSSKVRFWCYDTNGVVSSTLQSSSTLTAGVWYHVAVTYDGTSNADGIKLFLNSENENTGSTTNGGLQVPTSVPSNYKPQIGHNSPSTYQVSPWGSSNTPGELSNICIWDTNLSQSQVETLYNNGVPLTTAIASDNLKGWWKLSDNGIWDGTNWSVENQKYPANYESALKVTAIGSGITTASPIISNSTTHSTSWWVKYDFYRTREDLILIGQGLNYYLMYVQNSGLMGFRPTTASALTLSPSSTYKAITNFNTGKWYNYVFIRDGGNIKLYENNVKVWDATMTAGTENTATDLIQGFANLQSYPGTNTNYSNFSFFDTAISESDVQTLYNNGTPLTDVSSLTAMNNWYKLDNLTSGLQDSVGSNNATATGTVDKINTFVSTQVGVSSGMTEQNLVNNNVSVLNGESSGMTTANLVTSNISRTQPYSNYSFNFDRASSDYFDLGTLQSTALQPSDATLLSDGFSVSMWVNLRSVNTMGLWQNDGLGQANYTGLLLQINSGGQINFGYSDNTGAGSGDRLNYVTTNNEITALDTWYHIIAIYKGMGSVASPVAQGLYVNGIEVSAFNAPTGSASSLAYSASAKGAIGAVRNSVSHMDGKISNCACFDRTLTQDEVLNIYNNGVPQDLQATSTFSNNIVAWWPMDEHSSYYDGTDWVIRDLENGNDGDGANTGNVDDLVGNAPGSEGNINATTYSMANNFIAQSQNSNKNAYSINMADYADSVTNPANSGRSTDIPTV